MEKMDKPANLRKIPSVDKVLQNRLTEPLIVNYSHERVADAIRAVIEKHRDKLKKGGKSFPSEEQILHEAEKLIVLQEMPSIQPVINATGTIIHTNLGRSVLPEAAIEAVQQVAANPSNLEYDIEKGRRGNRDSHLESLICRLAGAEAATVVNNNAAAILLVLNTLAGKKEVILSRGEMVEIGASFRIPDIMKAAGCRLVEVGTTNRTRLSDYESAINKKTALLLKVHTSNYRIEGFSESTPLPELVQLGKDQDLPIVEDLGSGALVDLSHYGLPKEPVVSERIVKGADIVTFSGDKLLGGPQAGIIVGRKELIKKINKNPLKRALRTGKLTIATLEATLKLYLNSENLPQKLPSLRFLTRPMKELEDLASSAAKDLESYFGTEATIEVNESLCQIGSGALPEERVPSIAISIQHKNLSPEKLAKLFRQLDPPVIGRIHDNRFILDVRSVKEASDLVPKKSQ